MSLPKVDLRAKVSQETHDDMFVLARLDGKDLSVYHADLLEEAVAGRIHMLNLRLGRGGVAGLRGNDREREE